MRRITKLEAELRELEATRRTQRRSRARSAHREVSFVGYTNAGKSTLLNRLTDAGVLVENRLFSTLDPRTRRLELPGGETVLCTDTVGFVRKLPHQLVDAFHATLEVVGQADLLVHVVDGSASDPTGQIEAVRGVLAEIGAHDVPELLAVNKADRAPREAARLAASHPGAVAFSALTGRGVPELLRTIADRLRSSDRVLDLAVPVARGDVVAALHRQGEVIDERYEGETVRMHARLDEEGARRFEEFVQK
jgi:GTP-binding protein HflX